MHKPFLRRFIRALYLNLFFRRIPHGLMSPVYLLPQRNSLVKQHFYLWWQYGDNKPRVLWLLMEIWLWLYWVLWEAHIQTWRAVRLLGAQVAHSEGISQRTQVLRTLKLALLWCIPPSSSYAFGLYRNPDHALHYVYDTETYMYHQLNNQAFGVTTESINLLRDKKVFAQVMACAGIPVIPTIECVPKGANVPLAEFFSSRQRLFFKSRSGFAGKGAFSSWETANRLTGKTLLGSKLDGASKLNSAWRALLQLDDVLVQPYLYNHPCLDSMVRDSELITIRLVTNLVQDANCTAMVSGAWLEVPFKRDNDKHVFYLSFPVTMATGALGASVNGRLFGNDDQQEISQLEGLAMSAGPLPFWDEVVEYSKQAHCSFADVYSIAWDWGITAHGPVLLEGNSSWGIATLQQCLGRGVMSSEA